MCDISKGGGGGGWGSPEKRTYDFLVDKIDMRGFPKVGKAEKSNTSAKGCWESLTWPEMRDMRLPCTAAT